MKLVDIYDEPESAWILYKLLGQRTPEQSISHKEMPTMQEHEEFIGSNPYKAWFLIRVNNEYVGSVYLTKQREIGIFIFNKHKGNGYATTAIKLMKSLYPGKMYANVNPKNMPSRQLFEKIGGKFIQITFELP